MVPIWFHGFSSGGVVREAVMQQIRLDVRFEWKADMQSCGSEKQLSNQCGSTQGGLIRMFDDVYKRVKAHRAWARRSGSIRIVIGDRKRDVVSEAVLDRAHVGRPLQFGALQLRQAGGHVHVDFDT